MTRHSRGDALRLADILAATRLIASYITDGEAEFLSSSKTRDAVIRQLEVIGEAAGHVSNSIKDAHPKVPWRSMRGFASLAKLEYWRLDVRRLWRAALECEKIGEAVAEIRADP